MLQGYDNALPEKQNKHNKTHMEETNSKNAKSKHIWRHSNTRKSID